jgi:hypothetical protein
VKRKYADDHSVVIADITGAEVISYMEEFLPKPVAPGLGIGHQGFVLPQDYGTKWLPKRVRIGWH